MASWYSNILTNTTSRITNLQRSVFASEADGDTEDDTHVCRVLRQHYTESGRPLPNWLPPDPKAPPPAPIIQQNSGPAASRYGAPQQGAQGGLSSLWDNNRAAGRGAGQAAGSRNPFARNAATPDPAGREAVQARPLPSQRAGSVQSNSVDMGSGGGGGGASSAQDRLRQRLYGGGARTTSPSSSTGPFAPPPAQQGGGGGMPSRSRGGSGANAGSGDYDPYGPGGQFDSGGGGGGGGNRYGGLPSGPRRMGGLPSGPRMR